MYPEGVIYQHYYTEDHGETDLRPRRSVRILYKLIRILGGAMVTSAIVGLLFTLGPVVKEEVSYRIRPPTPIEQTSGFARYLEIAEAERVERVKQEAAKLGVSSYFSIVIPKIDAKAEIIANVDASNEEDYLAALKKGVAHAKGTYFPGQDKTIYLFAHSTDSPVNFTRYNAIFYLLRKLEKGDVIIVFFADEKYEYVVSQKLTTSADDTSWLTELEGSEKLVLQTCDPPGTSWRRLIIVAEPR